MGWYSLYRWYAPWSKRKLPNMIEWYSEYVLKTPEQRERKHKENKHKVKQLMCALLTMNTITKTMR